MMGPMIDVGFAATPSSDGLLSALDLGSARVIVEPGERLCARGRACRRLRWVEAGYAEREVDGHRVGRVGPGEPLGALGALFGAPEPASVIAGTAMILRELRLDDLDEVARSAVEEEVLSMLRRRGRASSEGPRIHVRAGSPGVDLEAACDSIESALVASGTRGRVQVGSSQEPPRGSDIVALIVDVDGASHVPPAELLAISGHLALVVQHRRPLRQRPRGAAGLRRWGAYLRASHSHHHVQAPADWERLVRRVTGRATTLVLGAGGCRGFAHLGVYRALVEAGVAIDYVAGTSMGGVVGALIARGLGTDTIRDHLRALYVDRPRLFDPQLPVLSALGARHLEEGLRACHGERRIEDLPLGFACFSTDLATMRPYTHRLGILWRACKASGTIPGLGPPVREGDAVLVDGAVLGSLPVSRARALAGGGRVIAVKAHAVASPGPESSIWRDYRPSLRPLERVRRLVQGEPTLTIPTLINRVIAAAVDGAVTTELDLDSGDMIFDPPVADIGCLARHRFDEAVALGYAYAQQRLRAMA